MSGPDPAAAWEAAVRELAARDDDFAVVPVFLALDDLGAPEGAPPPAEEAHHARLAGTYLRQALAGRAVATLDDVALVLHVMGALHFAVGEEVA